MAAFCGVVFLQSLYFQEQRDTNLLVTGLLFLPMRVFVVVLNPVVVRAMERFGKPPTMIGGQALVASGLLGLSLLPPEAQIIAAALLMIPVGVGGSFTVPPPPTALILDHVPADRAGTASGVLNPLGRWGAPSVSLPSAQHSAFSRITAARVILAGAPLLLLRGATKPRVAP